MKYKAKTKVFNSKKKLIAVDVEQYVRDVILSGRKAKSKEINLAYSLGWLLCKFEFKYGRECRPVEISSAEWRKDWGTTDELRILWDNVVKVRHQGYCVMRDGNKSTRSKDNVPNEYEIQPDEVMKIVRILGIGVDELVKKWIMREITRLVHDVHGDELTTGEFQYLSSSNPYSSRKYHPLTNKPKLIRNHVLAGAGYVHEYDVKSCFPSLLVELSGLLGGGSLGSIYCVPTVARAMDAPDAFRRAVAASCGLYDASGGLDVGAVKGVLSALLFGAQLIPLTDEVRAQYRDGRRSEWPAILAAVHGNYRSYWQVINNSEIRNYGREVRKMRKLLRGMMQRSIEDAELPPVEYLRQNNYLYWLLEQFEAEVRDAMVKIIKDRGGRVFELHDCVITDCEIDTDVFEQILKDNCRWKKVKLSHKLLSEVK